MNILKKTLTTLSMICLSLVCVFAQSSVLTGVVKDAVDGSPLPGVAVIVNTGESTFVTGLDGKYSVKASEGDVLTFSCLGMVEEKVTVGRSSVLNVSMKADIQELDDVMVVAYGTTKKESFTGSAEVVGGEKLKNRAASDVTKMLDGQVSGVMTTTGSGQPGSGAGIIIRGFGSINADNAPLVVVDGVPFDGDLNSISSNDIKSVSVLKDASAGALYGARGANGVILITTGQKAEGEKMTVSLSAKLGVLARAIPAYSTMSAKEYMEHMYQTAYNDLVFTEGYLPSVASSNVYGKLSGLILGTDNKYNIFDKEVTSLFDSEGKIVPDANLKYDENWMDVAKAKLPTRQEYQVGLNGVGDTSSYSASLGYVNEQGTLKTTGFKRYSARVGADFSPKEWFDFGANLNYAYTRSDFLGADGSTNSNVWYSAMMMAPIYPVYERNIDGSPVIENGSKVFDYGSSRPAGAQNSRNCVATLFDDDYYNLTDNLSARLHSALKWNGFALTSDFGLDNVNAYETTTYNRHNGNAAGTGRLQKENSRMMSFTWNQLLKYSKDFGEHRFDVLAGHEFYNYNLRYLIAAKTGFSFDEYDELAMGSTIADGNSAADNYSIDSFLGRLNYNYADKYYFSGSIRTDGSSRFKKENRWGVFWSLGASWRLSQEDFLKDVSWIDNLTLKASYGVQGNDDLGTYYAWQAMYNMAYANGSNSAAIIDSIENEDVTWEKNGNFNTGVEFKFLKRITGTIEWYNRKTSDLLLVYPMPISLGFPGYNSNVGSITNSGLDLTIGGDIIAKKDLNWNVTLMASTLKNKVNKLTGNDGDDIVNGNFIITEGRELNSFYMAKSAGVDPTTGEQLYYAFKKDENGNMISGSEYYTNDATVAAGSKYVLGSRIPDLYGSISTSFRFKNLDFGAMFSYSLGGKVYDSIYQSLMEPSYVGQTYHVNAKRSWTAPGQITDVPRATTTLSSLANDRFLVSASYLAIRNISVGYSIPKKFTEKCKIASTRIYLTTDSPWTFTCLRGMNPQQSFSGSTSYSYVPTRSMTLGLDIKF